MINSTALHDTSLALGSPAAVTAPPVPPRSVAPKPAKPVRRSIVIEPLQDKDHDEDMEDLPKPVPEVLTEPAHIHGFLRRNGQRLYRGSAPEYRIIAMLPLQRATCEEAMRRTRNVHPDKTDHELAPYWVTVLEDMRRANGNGYAGRQERTQPELAATGTH